MLEERLAGMGFNIIAHENITLAKIVEIVQKSTVEGVILDIHMPGLNGFDVLKAHFDLCRF